MAIHNSEQADADARLSAIEAALLVLAAFFLASSITARLWAQNGTRSTPLWLLASLAPPLVMLAGALWVARRHAPLVPISAARARTYLFAASALLLGATGGMFIGPSDPSRLAPLLGPSSRLVWAFAWIGVLAPIIEELYFRGVLQSALLRHMKENYAVPLGALAFAVAHIGVPHLLLWFALGVGLGTMAFYSRSIIPAILGHIGWNLGTVALAVLPGLRAAGFWGMLVPGLLLVVVASRVGRGGGEEA